jgi:hypothetical protein
VSTQDEQAPVAPEPGPVDEVAPDPNGPRVSVPPIEDEAVRPTLRELREDPRVPTMLVLRGLDGSEMPYPDPPGWLAAVREGAEEIERGRVVEALTKEAIHEEHLREFSWMERDGYTADQCGNCARWASYARAVVAGLAPAEPEDEQ